MKLKSIELRNFRSYPERSFDFDPAGNLIIGPNGSGKTNLLEAIAYTSIGKSIRYHSDGELMQIGADYFALTGHYETDSQSALKVSLAYDSKRKVLKINDQISRKLSELLTRVKVIYCAPDDIGLINGSPRIRRQYFDMAISQIFPAYLALLRDYLHIVDQRNRLLKIEYHKAEKRSWDQRFVQAMLALYPYRELYLKMLNEELLSSFSMISEKMHNVRICYQPTLRGVFGKDETEIMKHLEQSEAKEVILQRCLCGAHLDDYGFESDGQGMRAFASQGQKRIAVIILKLIQARLVEEHARVKPILLFDDIFAELDMKHSERIHELSNSRYQVFVASPKAEIAEIWSKMSTIHLGTSA